MVRLKLTSWGGTAGGGETVGAVLRNYQHNAAERRPRQSTIARIASKFCELSTGYCGLNPDGLTKVPLTSATWRTEP